MGKILVVGATGQLGSTVLRRLVGQGADCVALYRKAPSPAFHPGESGTLKWVQGDLADYESLERACFGVKKVIATASGTVPSKGDRFGPSEVEQYRNLIRVCRRNEVEHLVYISAFSSPYEERVPEFRVKRQVERIILESGVAYTIFRAAAFMDIYYAVMGSRWVMRGVNHPTLLRGFWLTELYAKLVVGLLEDHGVAIVPGSGKTRHSFICIDDVAAFMVKALELPSARNRIIELGGPESLSWREVAEAYGERLGKKVSTLPVPHRILSILSFLLRCFSPAGENILATLSLLGRYDHEVDMREMSEEFSIPLVDTRHFLEKKQTDFF